MDFVTLLAAEQKKNICDNPCLISGAIYGKQTKPKKTDSENKNYFFTFSAHIEKTLRAC